MKKVEVDYGKLIRMCRKRAKLSQEAFAHLLHTTQSTISRIEKNIIVCEAKFLEKAAKITNSEDIVIRTMFGIDVFTQLAPTVPMFIGGFSLWI